MGRLAAEEQSTPYASAVIGHWLNKTVSAVLSPDGSVQNESEFLSSHRLSKRTLSDECHRSDLMVRHLALPLSLF